MGLCRKSAAAATKAEHGGDVDEDVEHRVIVQLTEAGCGVATLIAIKSQDATLGGAFVECLRVQLGAGSIETLDEFLASANAPCESDSQVGLLSDWCCTSEESDIGGA